MALFAERVDWTVGRAWETLRARSFAMQGEYRARRSETESDARAISVSAIGGFVRTMHAAVSPGAGMELHTALCERAPGSTDGDAPLPSGPLHGVMAHARIRMGHGGPRREAAPAGGRECEDGPGGQSGERGRGGAGRR